MTLAVIHDRQLEAMWLKVSYCEAPVPVTQLDGYIDNSAGEAAERQARQSERGREKKCNLSHSARLTHLPEKKQEKPNTSFFLRRIRTHTVSVTFWFILIKFSLDFVFSIKGKRKL